VPLSSMIRGGGAAGCGDVDGPLMGTEPLIVSRSLHNIEQNLGLDTIEERIATAEVAERPLQLW
jgi:hypothetical protein